MSASKPRWIRVDACVFEHPKVLHAISAGGHEAITLWIRGIAYSAQHLTDGWIAEQLPKAWGYRPKHPAALVTAGLWHDVPITGATGWLINDYQDYQTTKLEWERKSDRAKVAALRRWGQ